MFINDIWSYGVTTNTKKIVAEAQKDGYLLNFLQLDLDEDGLPNWKTINSFVELVRTSTQNNPPDGEMNTPREKLDRLMNAIFLKTFNLEITKRTHFLPERSFSSPNSNLLIAEISLLQGRFTWRPRRFLN